MMAKAVTAAREPGLMGICVWSPRLDEHGNPDTALVLHSAEREAAAV